MRLMSDPRTAAIGPADSIRAVLTAHPELAEVFGRHGMGGCGGAAGPDEPIDRFAMLHRVDVSALVSELNRALANGGAAVAIAPALPREDGLYRRFVIAALVCTLTLGATFGAYNLLAIQLALG